MNSKISNEVFEWLLAQWAGFGENPAELFPSLDGADFSDLQSELNLAIRKTRLIKPPLSKKELPSSRQSSPPNIIS